MVHVGQRYRTTRELRVTVMTHWHAPFTGGATRTLRVGEAFAVKSTPGPGATAVYCDGLDPARLERELVPWYERLRFWDYGGYSLVIDIADLATHCEPLDR